MAMNGAREACSSMQQSSVIRARMVPISDWTRRVLEESGHQHGYLQLATDAVDIGRGVEPGKGLRLPGHYIQYSARHCQLVWQGNEWAVVDSSTNGTFVDGVKLEKHMAQPVTWGQEVRLSTTNAGPGTTMSYALEFRLELEDGNGDNYTSPDALMNRSTTGSKRKASSNDSAPEQVHDPGHTSAAKRHASMVAQQAMPVAVQQSTMHTPTAPGVQALRSSVSPQKLQPVHPHAAQPGAAAAAGPACIPAAARAGDGVGYEQHSAIHQANKLLRQEKKELKSQLAAQQQLTEARLMELQSSLQAAHKQDLDKLRTHLAAQLEQSEAKVAQQAAQLAELTHTVADMQHLKTELQALQEKLQHAEAQAQTLRVEHANTHQQLKESQLQCQQLQNQLDTLHQDLQAAQQHALVGLEQVVELKAQLAANGQLKDELEGLQEKEQEHREEMELQSALAQDLAREGGAAYQQLLAGLNMAYAAGPLLATMLNKMGQLYSREDCPAPAIGGPIAATAAAATLHEEHQATGHLANDPAATTAQLGCMLSAGGCGDTQQLAMPATLGVPTAAGMPGGMLPVKRNLWASTSQRGGHGKADMDATAGHASPAHTAGHVPTTQQVTQQHMLFPDAAALTAAPRSSAGLSPMAPPPAPASSGLKHHQSAAAAAAVPAGTLAVGSLQPCDTGADAAADAGAHAAADHATMAVVPAAADGAVAAPAFHTQDEGHGNSPVPHAQSLQEDQAMDVDNNSTVEDQAGATVSPQHPTVSNAPLHHAPQQAAGLLQQTPAAPSSPAQTSSAVLKQRQLPRLRASNCIAARKQKQLGLVSGSQASCGQLPEESQQDEPAAGVVAVQQEHVQLQEGQQQGISKRDAGDANAGDSEQQGDADMEAGAPSCAIGAQSNGLGAQSDGMGHQGQGVLLELGAQSNGVGQQGHQSMSLPAPEQQASGWPAGTGPSHNSMPVVESQRAHDHTHGANQAFSGNDSRTHTIKAPTSQPLPLLAAGNGTPRDSYLPGNAPSTSAVTGPFTTTCA